MVQDPASRTLQPPGKVVGKIALDLFLGVIKFEKIKLIYLAI